MYELRHKPIESFTVEDLRITIGQDVGLQYLLPMALTILEQDPLAKGMHFKGDLLCNVLLANPTFYSARPDLKEKAENILMQAEEAKNSLDEIDLECFEEALKEAVDVFKRG